MVFLLTAYQNLLPSPESKVSIYLRAWICFTRFIIHIIQFKIHLTFCLVVSGKTYLIRVSNLCLVSSINFRIQGHTLTLVEVEGSHTLQESYESLDIHPGQSATFLVTLRAIVKDYVIVASSRFIKPLRNATAILRYAGSKTQASGPLPPAPPEYHWSMRQARTIR